MFFVRLFGWGVVVVVVFWGGWCECVFLVFCLFLFGFLVCCCCCLFVCVFVLMIHSQESW